MNRKNLFTRSLMEIIRSNAQHHPNKEAISDSQIHYNYAQLLNEIDHQEKIIGQLGLQEGRVAIIQLLNRPITLILLISFLN